MTRRALLLFTILAVFMMTVTAITAVGLTIDARNSANISTLLTNGKTASAISAKAAAKNTAEAKAIINRVEDQLAQIQARADENHTLFCAAVAAVHLTTPQIAQACAS